MQQMSGNTPGMSLPLCPNNHINQPETKNETETTAPPVENKNDPLPTPVSVLELSTALSSHPNRAFVLGLCNIFRYGARIGFWGQRSARFSKNLPTAFEKPDVVSANLAKEVLLGRTAGPFNTPPFPNFQVSPIGLYPKRIRPSFAQFFICPTLSLVQAA
jgi:hypothetical protein